MKSDHQTCCMRGPTKWAVRLRKRSIILSKNLLKKNLKESSFLRFEDKIWQSNILYEKSNLISCVRLIKSTEILLVKLLNEKLNISSRIRLRKTMRMSPVKLLFERSNRVWAAQDFIIRIKHDHPSCYMRVPARWVEWG
jgi:hypothetical protein